MTLLIGVVVVVIAVGGVFGADKGTATGDAIGCCHFGATHKLCSFGLTSVSPEDDIFLQCFPPTLGVLPLAFVGGYFASVWRFI